MTVLPAATQLPSYSNTSETKVTAFLTALQVGCFFPPLSGSKSLVGLFDLPFDHFSPYCEHWRCVVMLASAPLPPSFVVHPVLGPDFRILFFSHLCHALYYLTILTHVIPSLVLRCYISAQCLGVVLLGVPCYCPQYGIYMYTWRSIFRPTPLFLGIVSCNYGLCTWRWNIYSVCGCAALLPLASQHESLNNAARGIRNICLPPDWPPHEDPHRKSH